MEEVGGAEYIGADKGQRVHDGAVDMAFGGQVDDGIEVVFGKELLDAGLVGDIGLFEMIVGGVSRRL